MITLGLPQHPFPWVLFDARVRVGARTRAGVRLIVQMTLQAQDDFMKSPNLNRHCSFISCRCLSQLFAVSHDILIDFNCHRCIINALHDYNKQPRPEPEPQLEP